MIENLFLSVGAMKAGTTWLYEHLKSHPDIYFSYEKEIHYFSYNLKFSNQLNWKQRIEKFKECSTRHQKGNFKYFSQHLEEISWYAEYARKKDIDDQWYEDLFRFKNTEKYCADFSNLYCQISDEGWCRVRKVAKNVKVVYTVRDPLRRLWSHYKFHMKWIGREKETITAGLDNFKDILDKPWFFNNSDYISNYEALNRNLKNDEFLLLYFEDFRSTPSEMLSRLQDFLEIKKIDFDSASLEKKINQTKEFEIPEDWYDYAFEKLHPLVEQMEKSKIWHKDWQQMKPLQLNNGG
jgi:hypothetical protein